MNASNERPRRESGFSLIELLIAMLIAIEILVAAAIAFDVHNRAAVVQTQITDLQQSLRVAQYDMARLTRMAGRGGLPVRQRYDPANPTSPPASALRWYPSLAIEVRNNVTGDERYIALGNPNSPRAIEGTDILTVRGCFANPVYQLQPSAFVPTDSDGDKLADGAVSFVIENRSVAGIRQPLAPLIETLSGDAAAPTMIFMSPVSRQTFGVGRVTAISPNTGDPDQATVTANVTPEDATNNPGSTLNPVIPRPAPLNDFVRGMPAEMTAALACLLEEYRFYVREVFEVPGDANSLRPRLTRARFEPGTERPFGDDTANFSLDLADGVFDLQVALGFDSDFPNGGSATPGSFDDDLDFLGEDDVIFEAARGSTGTAPDDWLFNRPGDDPNDLTWRQHRFQTRSAEEDVRLYYARLTTIARTSRPDPVYQAPDFDADAGDWIEDHNYDEMPAREFKSEWNRKFRRRMLTTVVDLRNI